MRKKTNKIVIHEEKDVSTIKFLFWLFVVPALIAFGFGEFVEFTTF